MGCFGPWASIKNIVSKILLAPSGLEAIYEHVGSGALGALFGYVKRNTFTGISHDKVYWRIRRLTCSRFSKQQTNTTLGAGNRRSQRMLDFFKGELFWEHPLRSQEMSILQTSHYLLLWSKVISCRVWMCLVFHIPKPSPKTSFPIIDTFKLSSKFSRRNPALF